MNGFAFEGGQMTARKLRQTVTAYSEGALQTALESGCKTVPEVMAFLARRDNRQAALHVEYSRRGKAVTDAQIKARAVVL